MSGKTSLALLVLANLVPLAGVWLWEWDVFLLLLLFWCENVIIGVFGIARLVVSASSESTFNGLLMPLFFMVHYGGFMFGHFMVLFGMYEGFMDDVGRQVQAPDYYMTALENLNWVAILLLFLSHGWSFVENFMGRREHDNLSPMQAMGLPYKRMVITHVALILGGFFLIERGQPLAGLVFLALLKIGLDVTFHLREHKALATRV